MSIGLKKTTAIKGYTAEHYCITEIRFLNNPFQVIVTLGLFKDKTTFNNNGNSSFMQKWQYRWQGTTIYNQVRDLTLEQIQSAIYTKIKSITEENALEEGQPYLGDAEDEE